MGYIKERQVRSISIASTQAVISKRHQPKVYLACGMDLRLALHATSDFVTSWKPLYRASEEKPSSWISEFVIEVAWSPGVDINNKVRYRSSALPRLHVGPAACPRAPSDGDFTLTVSCSAS
jgi:hypothetical protein